MPTRIGPTAEVMWWVGKGTGRDEVGAVAVAVAADGRDGCCQGHEEATGEPNR
jgi:hypothetical protein